MTAPTDSGPVAPALCETSKMDAEQKEQAREVVAELRRLHDEAHDVLVRGIDLLKPLASPREGATSGPAPVDFETQLGTITLALGGLADHIDMLLEEGE